MAKQHPIVSLMGALKSKDWTSANEAFAGIMQQKVSSALSSERKTIFMKEDETITIKDPKDNPGFKDAERPETKKFDKFGYKKKQQKESVDGIPTLDGKSKEPIVKEDDFDLFGPDEDEIKAKAEAKKKKENDKVKDGRHLDTEAVNEDDLELWSDDKPDHGNQYAHDPAKQALYNKKWDSDAAKTKNNDKVKDGRHLDTEEDDSDLEEGKQLGVKCNECVSTFNIGMGNLDPTCPKCGGYDIEPQV